MIGLLIALVSLLTFGSSSIFRKRPIRQIGIFSALLLNYVFTSILTLAALLLFSSIALPSFEIGVILFVEIIVGSAAIVAFYKAVEEGDLSLVSPVAKLSVVVTLLISLFFLNEILSPLHLVGSAVIIVSAVVIGTRRGRVKNLEHGIFYAILTGLGWGVYFALLKPLTLALGPFNTGFYTEAGIFAVVLIFVLLARKKISFTKTASKSIFAGAFLGVAGLITYNFAIQMIGAALSASVLAASPAFVALLSKLYLKEKIARYKYFAIAGIVLGLIILAIG